MGVILLDVHFVLGIVFLEVEEYQFVGNLIVVVDDTLHSPNEHCVGDWLAGLGLVLLDESDDAEGNVEEVRRSEDESRLWGSYVFVEVDGGVFLA